MRITEEEWPRVFEIGRELVLVMATMEVFAVSLALKTFHGYGPSSSRVRVRVAPIWTTNRGNGSVQADKLPALC